MKKIDFKEGLDIEFEIVNLSNIYKQHKAGMTTAHRLNFYQILWFIEGNPVHLVDFKPVQAEPNTLVFVGKDQVEVFDKHGEFEAKCILFTDFFFCKSNADAEFLRNSILFNDLLDISSIKLHEQIDVFLNLFRQMELEYQNTGESYHSDILRKLLHSFLLLAERERRKQKDFTEIKKSAGLDYTIQFKELLENQFREVKQVNEYARQLNITPKRLHQVTTGVLGESPKKVIDERVILEAKRLLAHSTDTIKEVGFTLGFDEPTNFSKYFKNNAGISPLEFREEFRLS
ncbi:helix-turn-helix domain-containing protein [Aliifodinibius sp. S!AR15-10]|uniref:AraC family transcriptional regulator n=1 Tax=Aliifodinibius sp. S!AR15-10 TaxID=2950437 RepID=UPI002861EFFE|nr:helix-turn-helix domain-containing protein [Aliifodinibius sp. S!AR15-10]MDR8394301.1 helix-turn-helix domain-containing protein [Aliifodinibius sp. S!AR15-10]